MTQMVDDIVKRIGPERHHVIQLLQAIQERHDYLPRQALERLCEVSDVTMAQIVGVGTFYSQFRFEPVGKHRIKVCHGTACHVKGAPLVQDAIKRYLNIPEDKDTDSQRLFTVEKIACLGCCTLAPVVQIDEKVYGYVVPEKVEETIAHFLEHEADKPKAQEPEREPVKDGSGEIRIGLGSCCRAKGSDDVFHDLQRTLKQAGIEVRVKPVGCVGFCYQTPLLELISPTGESSLYSRLSPEQAASVVLNHFHPSGTKRIRYAIRDLFEKMWNDESWGTLEDFSLDKSDPSMRAFLDKQVHIATEHFGEIMPTDLDEYLSTGGFAALKMALEMPREDITAEVVKSGLRGRGGAGFPTGRKWEIVSRQKGKKYIICNGDEGDPGAFMDRMLLESFPYRIIEGMLIAARAVGAEEGIFYVRTEYPLALKMLREAIELSLSAGYLGERIAGSDFSFHVRIVEGAGAFVSGEETALIAALEGQRSNPRSRPPYPAESGYLGLPTLVNNVETLANVPWIIRNGAKTFSNIGTEASKGTKVFALAGKVNRGGLIEVPMGVTVRDIVEEIGGGIEKGRGFKAVQIGGPSGGCLPAHLSNVPVDFEALVSHGAIMGSGGFVVLDDTDCMVDMAKYFLQFTQSESCGKCTPCRVGTKRMLEILTLMTEGRATGDDLVELKRLAEYVQKSSFCALGQTAPNPVLTTLEYFPDEYEAHLKGRCPAGKCTKLRRLVITDKCIGCTICAQCCPVDAIERRPYRQHEIDLEKCIRCGLCLSVCPREAIEVQT